MSGCAGARHEIATRIEALHRQRVRSPEQRERHAPASYRRPRDGMRNSVDGDRADINRRRAGQRDKILAGAEIGSTVQGDRKRCRDAGVDEAKQVGASLADISLDARWIIDGAAIGEHGAVFRVQHRIAVGGNERTGRQGLEDLPVTPSISRFAQVDPRSPADALKHIAGRPKRAEGEVDVPDHHLPGVVGRFVRIHVLSAPIGEAVVVAHEMLDGICSEPIVHVHD